VVCFGSYEQRAFFTSLSNLTSHTAGIAGRETLMSPEVRPQVRRFVNELSTRERL